MTATSSTDTPRPILNFPTIYALNVPKLIKHQSLKATFDSHGFSSVRLEGSPRGIGIRTWKAHFPTVDEAEKALVLLRDAVVPVSPPYSLQLSATPSPTRPPENLPLPHFLKPSATASPQAPSLSLAESYAMLRPLGPILSLRSGVDVGYGYTTVVVQFRAHIVPDRISSWASSPAALERGLSLQVYDPRRLYCTNFDETMNQDGLHALFQQYGQVTHVTVVHHKHPWGTVLFETEEQANCARVAMNKTVISGKKIVVRFYERYISGMPKSHSQPNAPGPSRASVFEEERRKQEEVRLDTERRRQEEARLEDERRRAAELKRQQELEEMERVRKIREAAQSKLQDALGAVATAEHAFMLKKSANVAAGEKLHKMEKEVEITTARLEEALRASQAAQDALPVVQQAAEVAAADFLWAEKILLWAKTQQEAAEAAWNAFEEQYPSAQATEDEPFPPSPNKDTPPGVDDDAERLRESMEKMQRMLREEELERSRRRMAGINTEEREYQAKKCAEEAASKEKERQETARQIAEQQAREAALREKHEQEETARREQARLEAERKAKEEDERRKREELERQHQARLEAERRAKDEEERLKQARLEAERKAEEEERRKREELERQRQEAERRERAWKAATINEEQRCRLRDQTLWPRRGNIWGWSAWTPAEALARFTVICGEFDGITFSEEQPLTFGSVPWPVLQAPYDLTVDHVDWSSVEAFFRTVRLFLIPLQYKSLVVESHRRFHPDKWRRRLNTVQNDQLRDALEKAIITTSQALTPLWQESRNI